MNTCLSSPHDVWPLGGIGRSGVHFTKGAGSLSGYKTDVEAQLHRLSNGGIFIDSRAIADTDAFYDLVINGPMVDTELPPKMVDNFGDRTCLASMLPGLSGGFNTFAAKALAEREWKGLDRVSVDIFVGLHLAVGARVGVREEDEMRWTESDGSEAVEPILACECWKEVCLGCHKFRYYVDRAPSRGSLITRARIPSGPEDHCPSCKDKKKS